MLVEDSALEAWALVEDSEAWAPVEDSVLEARAREQEGQV